MTTCVTWKDAGAGIRGDVTLHLGAVPLVVRAMQQEHRGNASIGEAGCELLGTLCVGADAADRRRAAAEDGAIEAVVQVMREHAALEGTGRATLLHLISGHEESLQRAVACGAKPGWLGAASLTDDNFRGTIML